MQNFRPRLTIALDPDSGNPVDACLSSQTRLFLEQWYHGEGRIPTADEVATAATKINTDERRGSRSHSVVEVPLTTDGDFFQILQREIASLEGLENDEKSRLGQEVVDLGQNLDAMMLSSRSKAETRAWQEIFQLYMDFEVFFSSRERHAGIRDSPSASTQLQRFTKTVSTSDHASKLRTHGSAAFGRFLRINTAILSLMKFQELNNMAVGKILKKFDKRTALHAQATLPPSLFRGRAATQALAKAACFQVSQQLLSIFPHLSDHSCPICLGITWKPIRLRCDHVFCIRCLVVMQREGQNHCPLCRQECVLEANSENLDTRLMEFLKDKFPSEVKAKQRENQRAAGVDKYGEDFNKKCIVM